jgi:hypothetical protein
VGNCVLNAQLRLHRPTHVGIRIDDRRQDRGRPKRGHRLGVEAAHAAEAYDANPHARPAYPIQAAFFARSNKIAATRVLAIILFSLITWMLLLAVFVR